jgi:hypothetical protein
MTRGRKKYLYELAEEYGVPTNIVLTLASFFGEEEDCDELVSALDDYVFQYPEEVNE